MLASFLYSLDACCGFLHFGSLARDGKQKKIERKETVGGEGKLMSGRKTKDFLSYLYNCIK